MFIRDEGKPEAVRRIFERVQLLNNEFMYQNRQMLQHIGSSLLERLET